MSSGTRRNRLLFVGRRGYLDTYILPRGLWMVGVRWWLGLCGSTVDAPWLSAELGVNPEVWS